jgi:hypothetical protein
MECRTRDVIIECITRSSLCGVLIRRPTKGWRRGRTNTEGQSFLAEACDKHTNLWYDGIGLTGNTRVDIKFERDSATWEINSNWQRKRLRERTD